MTDAVQEATFTSSRQSDSPTTASVGTAQTRAQRREKQTIHAAEPSNAGKL